MADKVHYHVRDGGRDVGARGHGNGGGGRGSGGGGRHDKGQGSHGSGYGGRSGSQGKKKVTILARPGTDSAVPSSSGVDAATSSSSCGADVAALPRSSNPKAGRAANPRTAPRE